MKRTFISRAMEKMYFLFTTGISALFTVVSFTCAFLIWRQPDLLDGRPIFAFLIAFLILSPLTYVLTCSEHHFRPRTRPLKKSFSCSGDLACVSAARLLLWSSVYLFWHEEYFALGSRIELSGLFMLFAAFAVVSDAHLIAHWLVYGDYENDTPKSFALRRLRKGGA